MDITNTNDKATRRREMQKLYYEANKEAIRTKRKEYYNTNKDIIIKNVIGHREALYSSILWLK